MLYIICTDGFKCLAVCAPTSYRLKIRDAMHDDMVKEQGFVIDLYVTRKETSEVLHIPTQIHNVLEN